MDDTRTRLLDAGEALFLRHGYAATGIASLLAAADAPKGSFYHHFSAKDDFAAAVVERWFAGQATWLQTCLDDRRRTPQARLRRYFTGLADDVVAGGWERGCLIGTLGQELATQDGVLRDLVARDVDGWREVLSAGVRETTGCSAAAARRTAGALIDAWEGALIRAKLERDEEPLRTFVALTLPALLR